MSIIKMSKKHVKMGDVERADSTSATKVSIGQAATHALPQNQSKCPELLLNS
jgi:hypothetical protein